VKTRKKGFFEMLKTKMVLLSVATGFFMLSGAFYAPSAGAFGAAPEGVPQELWNSLSAAERRAVRNSPAMQNLGNNRTQMPEVEETPPVSAEERRRARENMRREYREHLQGGQGGGGQDDIRNMTVDEIVRRAESMTPAERQAFIQNNRAAVEQRWHTMSDEERQQLMRYGVNNIERYRGDWDNMDPAQKQMLLLELQGRWQNMSEEERRQMTSQGIDSMQKLYEHWQSVDPEQRERVQEDVRRNWEALPEEERRAFIQNRRRDVEDLRQNWHNKSPQERQAVRREIQNRWQGLDSRQKLELQRQAQEALRNMDGQQRQQLQRNIQEFSRDQPPSYGRR